MTLHFSVLCSSGIGDIILGAGLVAKVVLLILTGLSAISWAIAINKIRAVRRSDEQTRHFLAALPRDFSIFEAGRPLIEAGAGGVTIFSLAYAI